MEDCASAFFRAPRYNEMVMMNNDDSTAPRADITRKDFLNATLLGAGAALLGAASPADAMAVAEAVAAPKIDPWTGPGGVGDYALSNGNTKVVIDAAHRV